MDVVNADECDVIIAGPTVKSSDKNAYAVTQQYILETNDETEDTPPWTIDINPNLGCDDTKMVVAASGSQTKKLCCPYCLKRFVNKLSRHLETVHRNEADVRRFCSFPRSKFVDISNSQIDISF